MAETMFVSLWWRQAVIGVRGEANQKQRLGDNLKKEDRQKREMEEENYVREEDLCKMR